MFVPKRSTRGCLTCKRRRKKCDEQKPHCRRCIQGDFICLGYSSTQGYDGESLTKTNAGFLTHSSPSTVEDARSPSTATLDGLIALPERTDEVDQSPGVRASVQSFGTAAVIPRDISSDPVMLEDATSFIISQFVWFSQKLLFKAPSTPVEQGLLWRIEYSEFTRWSMYLSARVLKDMTNGINSQKYVGWIFRFGQQMLEPSTATEPASSMEGRLGGLHDVAYLGFIVSGTSVGYSLFRQCTPTFLRLAKLSPEIWPSDFAISISKATQSQYEIIKFIANDTIIAMILGIAPVIHYDTTPRCDRRRPRSVLELVYGIPSEILCILAEINAQRASRMMGERASSNDNQCDIEKVLGSWTPVVGNTGEPTKDIARVAVQEAWRQAALIYFFMGMKEVNSADRRVQAAVRQVVQLGNTIEAGSPLERHLLIPCAGVAACQEKHRASLRSKLTNKSFLREITMVLRISEFVVVLDHLWHSAGKGGSPVTWDDYVQSRCTTIPISY
ncbi:maltose acetyltransferase, partial [Rhizoctonia solani]